MAAKNEATLYAEEQEKENRKKMIVKRAFLQKITSEVRNKRSLPDDFLLSSQAILK